jgi:RNA polymerase sigma-70 factor (ECF subfamily)
MALAILASREEAEDLTQDVFMALGVATTYDPARGSVGAFLIAMTRSRAIDRLRCRSRSSRLVKTWHEAATTAPQTPFECVSTGRAAARVRAVLTELPRTERQVLEMAYYQGLSQSEIAADLDTPLGTVKTVSRRALATLNQALTTRCSSG